MRKILIVEDKLQHIESILRYLAQSDPDNPWYDVWEKNGKIIDKKTEKEFKEKRFASFETCFCSQKSEIFICDNAESACKIIDQHNILLAFLDIYIYCTTENRNNEDSENSLNSREVYNKLKDKSVFTFIMSTDPELLKRYFKHEPQIVDKDMIQFIDKQFFVNKEFHEKENTGIKTDPGNWVSIYYSTLLSSFINMKSKSVKWRLVQSKGYFDGIDNISELYNNMLNGIGIEIKDAPDFEIKNKGNGIKIDEIQVKNEYGSLKYVLMHKPGNEIKKVTPVNCNALLFDMPVDYNKFSNQYKIFSKVVESITKLSGGKPIYVEDLLMSMLSDTKSGTYYHCLFILTLINKGFIPLEKFWELIKCPPEKIIDMVVAGDESSFPKDPIPNFIFTRDNIVIVHDMIFLPNMTKSARKRENCLMEFLLLKHPTLKNYYQYDFELPNNNSFEGGDIILVDEETVFVGISDRTTIGFVRKFAEYIFENNTQIKNIVGIEAFLQHERSMHLDTYMGVTGDYILILDDPLVTSEDNTFYMFEKKNFKSDKNPSVFIGNFNKLLNKLNIPDKFKVIEVKEKREAYDDACNILSVGKNKIITYERGPETLKMLGEQGFLMVRYIAESSNGLNWSVFNFDAKSKDWLICGCHSNLQDFYSDNEKYIFEIQGSELILARGGCHCMTMPLVRD
jgi:arginine deiminase